MNHHGRMQTILILLAAASAFAQEATPRYQVTRNAEIIILRDNETGVEASVNPKQGGELCSLRFKFEEKWVELIYRACDYSQHSGWRGKAPLLWPATGATLADGETVDASRTGSYKIGEKQYRMPFHGFAQGMPWSADIVKADRNEARALLTLSDTDSTRKAYPFSWRLSVEYRLREGRLFLVYNVGASNQNSDAMFFSIGNHMTFRTPFLTGDGNKVVMETPATALLKKDSRALPTGQTEPPPFPTRVELGRLEAEKPYSLSGYRTDPTLTLTDEKGIRLRIKHTASESPAPPYVQFNLWGNAKDGYFSPEPWVGAQNSFHNKLGLIKLKPGQGWRWTIELQPSVSARM